MKPKPSHTPNLPLPSKAHIYGILILFIILNILGLANLYSASGMGNFFMGQLRHAIMGMVLCLGVGFFFPIKSLSTYTYWIIYPIYFLLIFVFFFGQSAGGAQRWMALGPIRFQPSEMAKLAVVLNTAKFFYSRRSSSLSFSPLELWPLGLHLFFVFFFIAKQPDLGTAGLCLLTAAFQIAFIPIRLTRQQSLFLLTAIVSSFFIGWKFLLRPYQKLRIMNLLNPDFDPTGSGYNSLQSLVAIGSGGFKGKGYLMGTQSQLSFLPARKTDFIFSVFAEEHGFLGCIGVFLLFSALTYTILSIARQSKDLYNALMCIGIAGFIFIPFTINVMMALGLFPVVGIPLPFFSHGGTSLLTTSLAMGLLLAVERDTQKTPNN